MLKEMKEHMEKHEVCGIKLEQGSPRRTIVEKRIHQNNRYLEKAMDIQSECILIIFMVSITHYVIKLEKVIMSPAKLYSLILALLYVGV